MNLCLECNIFLFKKKSVPLAHGEEEILQNKLPSIIQ